MNLDYENYKTRKRIKKDKTANDMWDMYKRGYSTRQVAMAYGVSYQTVSNKIKSIGKELRKEKLGRPTKKRQFS